MPQVLSTTDTVTLDLAPWWEPPRAKEPVDFPDDPVTLAVASYNQWKRNNAVRWMDLGIVEVTQEDREQAIHLKKYYRDRLVIDALKGNGEEVSAFRQKLRKLVIDELVITQSEIGMLHRLPYFYEEDQALDRVIDKTVTVSSRAACQGADTTATYTLIERVLRSRKTGDYYDYWMASDQNPHLHLTVIKNDNPLRTMFESVIAKPVKLHTRLWTKQHRGHYRNRQYQQILVQGIAND